MAPPLSQQEIISLIQNKSARIHFVGIGGTGISALADFRLLSGGAVSGSDRSFDHGIAGAQRDGFIARGAHIFPQDGSGVSGAAALVASAAVEDNVPDIAAAHATGIPVIRRTEWIAGYTHIMPTIAITGTAGKSTTAAMIFEILRGGGLDPSLITGADLRVLLTQGRPGSAYVGTGPLVIEADESDRGIMAYQPETSVILNLGHDHDTPDRIMEIFHALCANTSKNRVVYSTENLRSLREKDVTLTGPEAPDPDMRITDIKAYPDHATFSYSGYPIRLPIPGVHNVMNATAAITACRLYGQKVSDIAETLSTFMGVARRFEVVGSSAKIEVIDDYAANTMKIAAAIKAAQDRRAHLVAYIQPVGFGPMRLMRADLTSMLAGIMRPEDDLFLAPIPYFGGTVTRDISSDDLVADIRALNQSAPVQVVPTRDDFIAWARAQDFQDTTILIMGARDPTLSEFARAVARAVC